MLELVFACESCERALPTYSCRLSGATYDNEGAKDRFARSFCRLTSSRRWKWPSWFQDGWRLFRVMSSACKFMLIIPFRCLSPAHYVISCCSLGGVWLHDWTLYWRWEDFFLFNCHYCCFTNEVEEFFKWITRSAENKCCAVFQIF